MPRCASVPLTVKRPVRIQSSASRRDARPSRASTFCKRSSVNWGMGSIQQVECLLILVVATRGDELGGIAF